MAEKQQKPQQKSPERKPAFEKKPKQAAPLKTGSLGSEIVVAALIVLIVIPALVFLFGSGVREKIVDALATPFAYLKMAATLISMAGFLVAVYSLIRLLEIMSKETKKLGLMLNWEHERTAKNERWGRVEAYMRSESPSDWKIAVLEADNILDEIVERMGYHGETLGERMKMIEPSDFPHLNEAWKAHKTRNMIAHESGTESALSRSLAEQTVNIYHRIFKELGYL